MEIVLYHIVIYYHQRTKEEKDETVETDGDGEEEEEEENPQPGDPETDKNRRCPNVQLEQRVECEGVLPSCDITEEDARRKWTKIVILVAIYTFKILPVPFNLSHILHYIFLTYT